MTVIVGSLFWSLPLVARAQIAGAIWSGIANEILLALAQGLGWLLFGLARVGAILFSLAGYLIRLGLTLNADVVNGTAVKVGWVITRDFTNLGFVIAILIVAIATMLRFENYSYKRLLPNLIIAALLVNFSLSIAGIFIDASGVVSNFFVYKATPSGQGGQADFATNLANAFQLNKIQQVETAEGFGQKIEGQSGIASLMMVIISLFFVTLFSLIGTFTMLTFAGLIIIRYIALTMLLILLPLAILSWVFGNYRGLWGEWLKKFGDWLLFLPISLFFVYLSVLITSNLSKNSQFHRQAVDLGLESQSVWDSAELLIKNFFQVTGDMIVIIGLLMGGLIVAKKFSEISSHEITKTITGWGQGYINRSVDRAKTIAKSPYIETQKFAGRKILGTEFAQNTANFIAGTRIPGINRLGSALGRRVAASKKQSGVEVDEFKKKYLDGLTTPEAVTGFTARMFRGKFAPVAKAAAAKKLAEMGKLPGTIKKMNAAKPNSGTSYLDDLIAATKETGAEDSILNVMPLLASKFGEDMSKVVSKIPDITKVDNDSFRNLEVLRAINESQFKDLATKGNDEQKKIIKETLKNEMNKLKSDYALTDYEHKVLEVKTDKDIKLLAKKMRITDQDVKTDIINLKNALEREIGNNEIDRIVRETKKPRADVLKSVSDPNSSEGKNFAKTKRDRLNHISSIAKLNGSVRKNPAFQ